MDKKKFEAVLALIVPQVVQMICENDGLDEVTATREFYQSALYASLEDETTKMWHLSPLMLFTLFNEEKQNGNFTFPEEA